jgi:hypothetical protein
MAKKELQKFGTKRELILAFALSVLDDQERVRAGWDATSAEVLGRMTARYDPRLYRGGHVIPGFGYSTQFISPMLPVYKAGDPELVKAND